MVDYSTLMVDLKPMNSSFQHIWWYCSSTWMAELHICYHSQSISFFCENSLTNPGSNCCACAEGLVDNFVITVYDNLRIHKHIRTAHISNMMHNMDLQGILSSDSFHYRNWSLRSHAVSAIPIVLPHEGVFL